MGGYEGQRVVITGGSAGIGRATALQLAEAGARVVVCARGADALQATVDALEAASGRKGLHGHVVADVTDRASMRAAAADATARLGGVDLLIANAGYARCRPILEADDAHLRGLMEVNYFGQVHTIQAFAPTMVAQGSGTVVLVSSMLAVLSVWGYGGYSASKFALRGFAEALRQELLAHGVRTKLFLPPTTDTPGLATENDDKPPLVREMEMGSSLNATHDAAVVARRMLAWIPKRRFVGYATFDSWFQYFAARHFPELTLRIADGELRSAQRRLAEGEHGPA